MSRTVSSPGDIDISARLSASPAQLTDALVSGDAGSVADFMRTWTALCAEVDSAIDDKRLTVRTISLARTVSQTVHCLAMRIGAIERMSHSVRTDLRQKILGYNRPPSDTSMMPTPPKSSSLPFEWVHPLLLYISENICSPYPSAEQKRQLLEQCAAAGWKTVTQRKLEDWMNMARGKMGYTFILKSDTIDEDRNAMAECVRRVLFGGLGDREGIPAAIIRRIEMMQQWVHNQSESRAAKDQTSSWARDVVDLVQRLSVPDDVGPDAISDDDEEAVYSDESDEESDSDTLYSDTDVEDDFDVFPTSVIGAKRKYDGLGLGQPPSRTILRSSSNSSLSSQGTLADLSVCDASASSSTTTDSMDEFGGDRPAKRRRSSLDDSSEERTSPTPTVVADSPPAKPKLFEHSYRSQKRKRSSTEDDSVSSPAKRVKHIVANPCAQVAATDLDALDLICRLDWDSSSAVAEPRDDVDLSALPIDIPSLDLEPCPGSLLEVVAACCEPPSSLHMDASFAWSKLQIYMLERMLRHGVHIVPAQASTPVHFTPSITFDASWFGPDEFAYLCSLSLESPGVRQALVGPPEQGLGPDVQEMTGLLRPVDTSVAPPSDGSILPSLEVDFDAWYGSLLSTPLVA